MCYKYVILLFLILAAVAEEVDGHQIEDIYEEDKQENIRKKTLMNMRMRSLKVPKGSHIHGFDILYVYIFKFFFFFF